MSEPVVIDTNMHGREGITASYLVRGERTALVETGPKNRVDDVLAGIEGAGVTDLDFIVVTHIHLDHAGAAGTLAQRFPNAVVCVHGVGAPHLADPSKLWSSASRIYGAAMESLWGGIDPIDQDRLRVIVDGERIDLGGRTLQAVETPGHAGHHHAYLDDATGAVFTGDTMGILMQNPRVQRPATPPPELNLEAYIDSIERVRSLAPSALYFTHFGKHEPDDEVFDTAIDDLRRWESWVAEARTETVELDEVTSLVRGHAKEDMEGRLTPEQIDRLEQTTSYRMNVMGFMRYLDKKNPPN